ncbi:TRAP transporter small permease [Paracoccus rhizosphaerae]|uniref:TRAP transporter small permease protein n=1 Tax=Paracoccus rhizosphaerae TaxID=1133347 RepID=A0ABV6CDQ9_9RHOB|nr:TRAP transporter small permease subunit [Paracoccus rhizosphaerae]
MLAFILRDAEKLLCALLFMAMTVVGFANVVVRYATNYSLAASEELLTNGFLLLTVLGAAIAARQGQHLAVTALVDALPRALRVPVFLLSVALSVLLLVLSAWFAWQALLTLYANGLKSYALGIPAWWYQAGVPFAFLLIVLRFLQHSAQELRQMRAAR